MFCLKSVGTLPLSYFGINTDSLMSDITGALSIFMLEGNEEPTGA